MTIHFADGVLAALVRSVAFASLLGFTIGHEARAADNPSQAGQNMSPLPAASTQSEFGDSCTMGLASGQTVKTDCSVKWQGADGKVYCFSSENSKAAFLKNPEGNLKKARDFLASRKAAAAAGAVVPSWCA